VIDIGCFFIFFWYSSVPPHFYQFGWLSAGLHCATFLVHNWVGYPIISSGWYLLGAVFNSSKRWEIQPVCEDRVFSYLTLKNIFIHICQLCRLQLFHRNS
jgi:hypothetical protein